MITRILINNSPAFKLLELQLFKGFNVFSGSSGSGKSVFMESLLAIFGIKDSNADLIEANITIDWMQVPQDVKELLEDGDDEIVCSSRRNVALFDINCHKIPYAGQGTSTENRKYLQDPRPWRFIRRIK